MPDRLILTVLPAVRIGKDGCDRWMNIERDSKMVGKVRYSLEGERLTIYSIMIFPEYSGYGYGARAISLL